MFQLGAIVLSHLVRTEDQERCQGSQRQSRISEDPPGAEVGH